MYLLIIFLIVGIVIAYLIGNLFQPFAWSEFFTAIVGTIIFYAVTLFIVRLEIASNHKNYLFEYKDQPIESLINKSAFSLSGEFILGCGSISGNSYDYYVAYAKFPQGY